MTDSLRLRLPLLISGLIAVSLLAFLSIAFVEVQRALLQAGATRALAASDQLASLLVQSTQQRAGELQRVARDPAVRAYLTRRDGAAADVARPRLQSLSSAGQPPTELWDADGARLLAVPAAAGGPGGPPPSLPATRAPTGPAVGVFQSADDAVYWDTIQDVREGDAGGATLGYIVSRRLLTGSSSGDAIGRLVGNGAAIKLGTPGDGVWTNLSTVVTPPTVAVKPGLLPGDTTPDGSPLVAAASAVRGTPWLVAVEFPRAAITAPARTLLWRMLLAAIAIVAGAAVVAHVSSSRITTPLSELTHAAEAVADGRTQEPLAIRRTDEIGRLGAAFDSMAARVHTSHRQLEARVEERTADIRDLNAQLERRVDDLKELTDELEAFSYSVSHDLRAPLRHVVGFASLLEKSSGDGLDARSRRYLQTISDAGARMGQLIDDLLAFSRMNRADMLRTRVDLAALVQEARQEVIASAAGHRIEWTIGSLPQVQADPVMLRQVLTNLLSNAVKYSSTRETARIEVTCRQSDAETVLQVRDNGVGFDMQHAGKLFGVFQRLHRSEEFEGTGIGLASVRRIMNRHGGSVWAESEPDRGASFFVSRPNHAA